MDSGGHLLAALNSQPHVAVVVSDGDESLEPRPLSSPGLLLHRHDLQHLILQGRADEHIDDLVLLDGKREKVNFLQTLDLSILYKTAKLGHRDPILLFLSSSSSASATASVSSTSSPSSITSSSSVAKSSSETTTITTAGWSSVRHSLVEVNQAN